MIKTFSIVTGVVKRETKVLLLKRSDTKELMPGLWEFPSGYIERFESAEQAVLREVKEETGLICEIAKTSAPLTFLDGQFRWIVLPFLILVTSDLNVRISTEHSDAQWVSVDELDRFTLVIGTKKVLEHLLD